MSSLRPVVLSGGSGTRLWPISTPERPKQFAPLFGASSLFEETLRRVTALDGAGTPIVVTGLRYERLTQDAVAKVGTEVVTIAESTGRDTAPAAVASALVSAEDDVLVIVPSDHVVADFEAFAKGISDSVELARDGHIVALGVVPTRPETGYGYIGLGAPVGGGHLIDSFVEKPDVTVAERLITGGQHLWNAGMFVVSAGVLLSEAELHKPGLVDGVRGALVESNHGFELDGSFDRVESISVDYAVMEKTSRGAVVRLDAGWSDVGSYASLLEILPRDQDGNAVIGTAAVRNTTNSLVQAESKHVVVAGVDGVAVVETAEQILVIGLDASQDVRDLANEN